MPKFKRLDATTVKILAIVLMTMDHIHQMFASVGAPLWLTAFGRLVFPLFLFTSAESFHYTRNKAKYLMRLLFASWAMTLITTLTPRLLPNDNIALTNNAFTTFFLAGLYMLFWDRLMDGIKSKSAGKIVTSVLLLLAPVAASLPAILMLASMNENTPLRLMQVVITLSLWIPNLFFTEGGFAMALLGLLFYIFRKWRYAQVGALAAISALVLLQNGGFGSIQWLMVFAAIPMLMYNGQKGRGMKLFFYIYYPAHIVILYVISTLALR